MKAWERRTWLCTCAEITCLRTLTGSCIARAQRTWKTDCKANFYSPLVSILLEKKTTTNNPPHTLLPLLQVHCIWRRGGPGCWWFAEGVVHDHLPGDVQPHVRSVPYLTRWPRHIHHQPLISLQPQPPQLLQVCGSRGGQGGLRQPVIGMLLHAQLLQTHPGQKCQVFKFH